MSTKGQDQGKGQGKDRVTIRQLPTGVPGLDEILGGGLPEFSFNIIAGAPGCGKTTLAHQIMFANATPEQPALYFTVLGEPAIKMLRYQQQYSFFDDAKMDGAIRFINLSQVVLDQDLGAVLDAIINEVEASKAGIVVVDSFRTVVRKAPNNASEVELQGFVQRLALHLTSWQATTFLIGEYVEGELRDNPVFTVADGLLWLYQSVERNSIVRKMQVMKMRGQESVPGLHTFRVTNAGLQTFPRTFGLVGEAGQVKGRRRLSTGIGELDALMGGGIPEGDSLLLAGPSGSGKSTLGTQFIAEGLRHGEPGIVAVFEEIPAEYAQRAAMFGFDFDTPQKDGTLKIIYLRPLDLSVDETVHEIVNSVRKIGCKRLVIDSLVGFEMALAPGSARLPRVAVPHDRGPHPPGRDHRHYRRSRRGVHLDEPEQLHSLVPGRRHRALSLRLDQWPTPQDAPGREDAPQPAQHRHGGIPDHLQGDGHRLATARLPRPDQRHPRPVVS